MKNALAKLWRRLNAAQIAVLSFAAVILLGAVLLLLPISVHGQSLSFTDALFTATSATCVTGLIVVDTGTKFTGFGQAVILLLIQAGGFGIMTLSTLLVFMLGRKATLSMSDAAGGSYLKLRRYSLAQLLKWTLVATFSIETAGAIMLFSRWIGEYSWERALWLSVFHSVSAFCNAGFSLYSDSLIGWAGDPTINFSIIALIVLGGLGFFVLIDLWDTFSRDPDPAKRRLSFHTKIVLAMSVILIVGGAAAFWAIEYQHGLKGLSPFQAGMRSLFQSITTRTAGFNSMDIGHLSNAALFLMIMLMFVGGAPGSMAGGVKVTTIGVILIVVFSRLRGRSTPSMFGRSIARENQERALALLLLAGFVIATATMIMLISELGGASHVESRGMFMEILFEVVSAFGTVGLSSGITSGLSETGKLIITFIMFAGRLGPMTLVFALERRRPGLKYRYPTEQIMVG